MFLAYLCSRSSDGFVLMKLLLVLSAVPGAGLLSLAHSVEFNSDTNMLLVQCAAASCICCKIELYKPADVCIAAQPDPLNFLSLPASHSLCSRD